MTPQGTSAFRARDHDVLRVPSAHSSWSGASSQICRAPLFACSRPELFAGQPLPTGVSIQRAFLVLLLTLSLSGCGVRFLYSQLDWLIPWQLRDYVSLDGEQQSILGALVSERLDWHCQTQLPRYAEWLRQVESDLRSQQVSVDWLAERAGEAEAFWAALMRELSIDASVILGEATDAQLQELFDNLDARTREQMDQFVNRPDAVLIQERAERMEQRLRRWFGPMNAAQRARIASWSEDLGLFANDWLENRGRWQARLRHALIEARARPETLQPALEALLVHPESAWSPEYVELLARQSEAIWILLADLYDLSTARQRMRLLNRVDGLARDFERLSCPVGGTA